MQKLSHAQLAALVKRVQHGDSDAFATLYAATVESQLYFATTFLKDAAMAEDVVQEVYLSLYKSIDKLTNPKLIVAYLNRICYNTCVDFKRNLSKRQYELDEEVLANQPDTTPDTRPDDRYMALEQSNELHRALAALPDEHRAVFLYRYYNELRIQEIAAIMGCSDSTVKRYIKAATQELKRVLQSAPRDAAKKDSSYVHKIF